MVEKAIILETATDRHSKLGLSFANKTSSPFFLPLEV